jgi:plastocyanin
VEQIPVQKAFTLLVSYTDRGFEPSSASIDAGETVRFTNNSSADLWVAADGTLGKIYPGTGNECGQSALDTCKTLAPGEFWQFTFNEQGTWGFHDSRNAAHTGVITVQ